MRLTGTPNSQSIKLRILTSLNRLSECDLEFREAGHHAALPLYSVMLAAKQRAEQYAYT